MADTDFKSYGMTHSVSISPSDGGRGKAVWLFRVSSMGGSGLAFITEEEGFKLAELLAAGIPEDTPVEKPFDISELL